MHLNLSIRQALATAVAVATLAVAPGASAAGAGSTTSVDTSTSSPDCVRLYKDRCSEPMHHWLPAFPEDETWWKLGKAAHLATADAFAKPPGHGYGESYVFDGTVKATVVYDAAHDVAFSTAGSGSVLDVTIVAGVAAPPRSATPADLSGVATKRGLRLGMTVAQVERIDGPGTPIAVAGKPGLTVLPYTTSAAYDPQNGGAVDRVCGEMENVFFTAGRARAIEIGTGC